MNIAKQLGYYFLSMLVKHPPRYVQCVQTCAEVRVIMLSDALAMLVCGCVSFWKSATKMTTTENETQRTKNTIFCGERMKKHISKLQNKVCKKNTRDRNSNQIMRIAIVVLSTGKQWLKCEGDAKSSGSERNHTLNR
jgi:hypothetical protein